MVWKIKKSYFSVVLYIFKRNYPSPQAYNGVKNVSVIVCYFLDDKVFS